MSLSIIIACLNDQEELKKTLESIFNTTAAHVDLYGKDVEIIVVDDHSDDPLTITFQCPNTHLSRNERRLGPGASRQRGVEKSTGEYILLLDSHMRFEPGWFEKAMERITKPGRENFAHCGSCLGLETTDMFNEEYQRDELFSVVPPGRRIIVNGGTHARKVSETSYSVMEKGSPVVYSIKPTEIVALPATPRYFGAALNILGPNPNNPAEFQVLEGVWANEKPGDDYEISSLMGACYFFKRDFFLKIGGLKFNRQWGSEEPNLSLKTYLAGGSVRLMKGVRVGHKFHSGAPPYKLYDYWKHYNKMRTVMTIFNECEAQEIMRHFQGASDVRMALSEINRDRKEIMAEHAHLQSLFVHDLQWFCNRFNLAYPIK